MIFLLPDFLSIRSLLIVSYTWLIITPFKLKRIFSIVLLLNTLIAIT